MSFLKTPLGNTVGPWNANPNGLDAAPRKRVPFFAPLPDDPVASAEDQVKVLCATLKEASAVFQSVQAINAENIKRNAELQEKIRSLNRAGHALQDALRTATLRAAELERENAELRAQPDTAPVKSWFAENADADRAAPTLIRIDLPRDDGRVFWKQKPAAGLD